VGKKDERDAAANFFGDSDLDWMGEEDASKNLPPAPPSVPPGTELPVDPEKTGDQLPVAPPPPPPVPAGQKTATPKLGDPQGEDWSDKVSEAPEELKKLSSAPTLVFSSVPTLPPQPSPASKGEVSTPSAPPDADEVDPDAPMSIDVPATEEHSEADAPTVEIDKKQAPGQEDHTEVKAPEPEPEPPSEVEQVFGDAFSEKEEPLVRTSDPAPARVQTPAPAPPRQEVAPDPAPAPAPAAPRRLRYAPRATRDAWREAATVLVAAAGFAGDDGRAGLLFEAGHIYHRRVDDLQGAETMYRDAASAGHNDPRLHRSMAELFGRAGRHDEQVQALRALAARQTGGAEVDALTEAGLVLSRRLQRQEEAVEMFRQAARADDRDYISRALLRALLPTVSEQAEERLAVLRELAALAEGGVAADAMVERAIVLEQTGRGPEAQDDLRAALEHEPGHTVAFLRLERLLSTDGAAQADLYIAEACREGQPDAGWWWYKAANALHTAGDGERAQEAYAEAVAAGYLFAERERQAAWTRSGAHTELVASLQAELDATDDDEEARAFAAFRLGWARETVGDDRPGALAAYREAVELDPHAAPANDGVSRLLASTEGADALRDFWRARRDAASEDEQPFVDLRLAEIEESDGRNEQAREAFEAALSRGVGLPVLVEVASAGLERVLTRLEDWGALRALLAERAEASEDMRVRSSLLRRAARVGPSSYDDEDASLQLYRELLSLAPDDEEGLERTAMLLEGQQGWSELADLLKVAGSSSTDPVRRAALLYRAARVLIDRCDDARSARPCLESAVAARGDFLPALWLLREACGVAEPRAIATMYRQQASATTDAAKQAWMMVAAASMSAPGDAQARQDLRQVLAQRSDHPGAVAALEVRCLVDGDHDGLIDVYRGALVGTPSRDKARLALRVSELLVQRGRSDEAKAILRDLATWSVSGRPLRAGARLACSLGAWQLVGELLAGLDQHEDRMERARILGQYADAREALALYESILDGDRDLVAAGSRASTVAQRAGDRDAMVRAYGAIAENADSASLRAAYGAWTAMQLEGMGAPARALDYWRIALDGRPDSSSAFRGTARCLASTGSAEELRDLFATHAPDERRELADYLLAMGEAAPAAEALAGELDAAVERGATSAGLLPLLVIVELVREQANDWQGAYDALCLRREHTEDPTHIQQIDAKRRWLLREKLADTDAAWELYRSLHDEAPEDREVTEALARIAGARGETNTAIGYLRELAESTSGPEEAARYQRRIGEVYEAGDDPVSARQAYLDALDHVNDDQESLDGLKRLARQAEDWPALVAVLQREVNLAEGERERELCREVAEVTEDKLGDPLVAIDAWRAVLERDASDRQALERLVELSESQAEWGTFVEAGEALAGLLDGAERGRMLYRVGVVCQDQLDRNDAIRFYDEAVAVEPPNHDAAVRLEELHRGRANWDKAIEALQSQVLSDVDTSVRIDALLRAARLEIEARHDRDAAATFYNRILEHQPDHEGALRFMASHLFEAGRFDEALPICERLEPIVERGQDLDDFDTRMELASFYFYMAEMLRLQLEEERAVPRYERALELNATHLATLEAVGPLYLKLESWKKAERVYRQLLQLSGGQGDREKVASTYTNLGLVERALGNREKAQKRFTKALELHPNHVGALKGMALVLEDQATWSSLLNVYNSIICHATDPDDVKSAYMTKGRILDEQMQRQDKAAQHYQRSLDFEPDQPVAYLRLAELAMRRDAYQEAGALADRGLSLDSFELDDVKPLLLVVRACARQDAGQTEAAERAIADAVDLDSELGDAMGAAPLRDLEGVRQVLKERLPL